MGNAGAIIAAARVRGREYKALEEAGIASYTRPRHRAAMKTRWGRGFRIKLAK